ncbi:MAG TPA: hypothetical protein ACFCUD_13015 [Cyclobacteriaceae bacterium]
MIHLLKIFTLLSFLCFAFLAKADQLAYLSKKEAKKAYRIMKKMDYLYLYCGCCDNDPVVIAAVIKAEVKITDYENYYEVVLTYKNPFGEIVTHGVDLAYVWTINKGKPITVGELMKLEHDPCNKIRIND